MKSSWKKPVLAMGLMLAGALGYAAPAAAQATRTWVSGVGDDVNPCSRTAPCKTFAGAISKTANGGEINCLDPGGYGTVTITKSITIDCTGTFGSVLNSGTTGIIVNDASGAARVVLRGLTINGAGTTVGLFGVRFLAGSSLVLDNVFIQNQSSYGIAFQPSTDAKLVVNNVTIANSVATSLGGVLAQPTGSAGADLQIQNTAISGSSGSAIRADGTGNSGPGISILVADTSITGMNNGVDVNVPSGTTAANVLIQDSLVSNLNATGLLATGSGNATIRASNTTITLNTTGVSATGGANIQSFGNNRLLNNTSNGAFTGSILPTS